MIEKTAYRFAELNNALESKNITDLNFCISQIVIHEDSLSEDQRVKLMISIELLCKLKVNEVKRDLADRLMFDVKMSGL